MIGFKAGDSLRFSGDSYKIHFWKPGFQGPNFSRCQRVLVIQLRCIAMQTTVDVLLDVAATCREACLFLAAMENGPFEDVSPIKTGGFPLLR